MTEVFCKAKGALCDPKNCNREFCWWRDTVWAVKNMSRWAYDTSNEKPKSSEDAVSNSNGENPIKPDKS